MSPDERASLIYADVRGVRQGEPGSWVVPEDVLVELLLERRMRRGLRLDPPHVPPGPHGVGQ
jgi:hypothetical protein